MDKKDANLRRFLKKCKITNTYYECVHPHLNGLIQDKNFPNVWIKPKRRFRFKKPCPIDEKENLQEEEEHEGEDGAEGDQPQRT